MPKQKVIRNKNYLLKSERRQDKQPIRSLLKFVDYKQTFFPIHSEKGSFILPANKISSVVQIPSGSIIYCKNNKSFYSSQPIDFWEKSLSGFEQFVEDNKADESKIIPLT